MTFNFDGNDYDIKFEHMFIPSRNSGEAVRKTICTISQIDLTILKGKERYTYICGSVAVQHVNDKDVKATARKIALGKTIKMFIERTKYNKNTTSKMIRKRIWSAYFSECELKTFISDKKNGNDVMIARSVKEALKNDYVWVNKRAKNPRYPLNYYPF